MDCIVDKERTIFLNIKNKKFLISDIKITDDGQVTYQLSSLSDISNKDRKEIEEFLHKLLFEELQWN